MEQQENKRKDFSTENLIKSWFTTILGCVVMGTMFWQWNIKQVSDWQALIGGSIGFALLFMRDAIPGFIKSLFEKKL